MASATLGGKHVKVVLGAVSLAVLLVEAVFAKVLAALSAEEMFWMPGLFQGSDARLRENETERGRYHRQGTKPG